MPFTLSHPAAAVPFAKRGLPLSALVVGSLSPDFLYFFRLSTSESFGHSIPGILLFDVPVGLAILWIFHHILKYPLIMLLPGNHQRRLLPVAHGFRFGPFRQFWLIILGLVIGAVTHIVWDSFTHEKRWIVQHSLLLSATLLETPYGDLKVYKLLQHGSTLLGAGLLIYWYSQWFRAAPEQELETPIRLSGLLKIGLIILMGVSAFLFAGLYSLLNEPAITSFASLRPVIGRTIVTTISALFVEFVIFSLIWRLQHPNLRHLN
jgi:hypothetical protein